MVGAGGGVETAVGGGQARRMGTSLPGAPLLR